VISFEQWKDGFCLVVDGKQILHHSSSSPAIFLASPKKGVGKETDSTSTDGQGSGAFHIEARNLKWNPLKVSSIEIEHGERASTLKFKDVEAGAGLRLEYLPSLLKMSFVYPAPELLPRQTTDTETKSSRREAKKLAKTRISEVVGFRILLDASANERLFGLDGNGAQKEGRLNLKKTQFSVTSRAVADSRVFADSGSWLDARFSGKLNWRFEVRKTVFEVLWQDRTQLPELAIGLNPAQEISAELGLDPAQEISAGQRLDPAQEISAELGLDPAQEISAELGLDPAPLEGLVALSRYAAAALGEGARKAGPILVQSGSSGSARNEFLQIDELLRRMLSLSFSGEGQIAVVANTIRASWTAFSGFFILETGESLDISADDVALESFLQGCDDRQIRRAAMIFVRLQPYHLFCRSRWQEAHVPEIVHPGVYYPGMQGLWKRSDEFLYGPDILVAPFKEDKGKALYGPRELILPSDGWVHLWTSRVYPEGQTFVDTQAGRPAVFYRQNSEFARLFDTIRQMSTRL